MLQHKRWWRMFLLSPRVSRATYGFCAYMAITPGAGLHPKTHPPWPSDQRPVWDSLALRLADFTGIGYDLPVAAADPTSHPSNPRLHAGRRGRGLQLSHAPRGGGGSGGQSDAARDRHATLSRRCLRDIVINLPRSRRHFTREAGWSLQQKGRKS